ncbi:hypothetical protein [Deinococcus sp. UYEF24]
MSIVITFLEVLFLLLTGPFLISSPLMFMAVLAWTATPKPTTKSLLNRKRVQLFLAYLGTLAVVATQALLFLGGMNGSSIKSLLLEYPICPITAVLDALLLLTLNFFPNADENGQGKMSFRKALLMHFPKRLFTFIPAGTPLWRASLIRLLRLRSPNTPVPIQTTDSAQTMSLLAGLSVLIPVCTYPVSALISTISGN